MRHARKEPKQVPASADSSVTENELEAPPGCIQPVIRLTEYECSIEQHAVTFTQVVQAYHGMRNEDSADMKQSCAYYYPALKSEFEAANGAIEELHFCRDIDAGAALTDRTQVPWDEKRRELTRRVRARPGGRRSKSLRLWLEQRRRMRAQDISVHLTYPSENVAAVTPTFQQALWRCFALARMGDQLLRPENSRILARRSYAIVVNLLSVLDAQMTARTQPEQKEDRIREAIATTNQEIGETKKQYEAAARWDSQYAYIKGMLWGLLLVGVLLAGSIASYRLGFFALDEFAAIAVSWALGAIGAVVSVMSRLASDKFYINYQAEHQSLRMLGRFRPLIGAVFGSSLFILIAGGLLMVEAPGDSQIDSLFFFAALAFLAGFTERLAPDAFAVAATKVFEAPGEQAEPAGAVFPEAETERSESRFRDPSPEPEAPTPGPGEPQKAGPGKEQAA